jgi:hypothetical protein
MKASHRLSVVVAHGLLELLVNIFIEANCKHGKGISSRSRDYTQSAKLVILHELRFLTDWEFERFDWLRKLRNRAAHDPLFAISRDDLALFKDTEHSDPANFHDLCIYLVAGFWNRHVELFGPKVMPELFEHPQ